MEEVDQTIIPILRDIGCKWDEDVRSIADFSTPEIVQAVSHALYTIDESLKFPTRLPPGNAARFRICTQLSQAITELGYSGEAGYQQFLYPNEKDMRRLLIWLIDKMPKAAEDEGQEQALGTDATLNRTIIDNIRAWGLEQWSPFVLATTATATAAAGHTTALFRTCPVQVPVDQPGSAATRAYQDKHQPVLSLQCPARSSFLPSVLEHNADAVSLQQERERDWEEGNVEERRAARRAHVSKLVAAAFANAQQQFQQQQSGQRAGDYMADLLSAYKESTLLSRRAQFEQEGEAAQAQVVQDGLVSNVTAEGAVEEDEDAMKLKMEQELAELQAELHGLAQQAAHFAQLTDAHVAAARQVESELQAKTQETKTLEDAYKVKKRTLDLLPNAQENLQKLGEISAASAARLVELSKEWETHRVPMLAKYRRKKQLIQDRKDEARSKLELIKSMRAEMKQMAVDVRERDAEYKQAVDELNKLPKSVNRQVYVRRIMDIVRSLNKQKADIRKILTDVRSVQRDINSVGETSKRSFAETDEVIFQAAKKKDSSGRGNPAAAKSFKLLTTLREGFDQLVKTVEDVGKAKNAIKEITSNIDALESRNTGLNMSRIKEDLAQVKRENKELVAKVQQLKKQ